MPKLGVNIDHVATLRQARREFYPDPIEAAVICERAGADSIVAHLREDRRHMNDQDIFSLKKKIKMRFNLEMSLAEDIIAIAGRVKPDQATIVPERRAEVTTEGGLNVDKYFKRVREANRFLAGKGIDVSLFIAPDKKQIIKSYESGVRMIEFHTGEYALAKTKKAVVLELNKLKKMTLFARSLGLVVNAGHGLKYHNTKAVAAIEGMEELNIGHSIVSRAVFVGLEKAVREMKKIISAV